MTDNSEPKITIKYLCQEIRSGRLTFDEGIDELVKVDPDSPLGRIDHSDFLWKILGRPTDEQLLEWEKLGGR